MPDELATTHELAIAQAEIARLKSENEALKGGAGARGTGWMRSTAVVLLFALGFLLVPAAGLAVWSRNTLLNTDRYVETVAPLAESQPVIDDVATAVTNAIFAQIDVEQLLADNLPSRLAFAAGPITNQIESTTRDLVVKALESDRFAVLWREVNRQASASVVAFVTGSQDSTVLQIQNGRLFLELQPIVEEVKARLSEQGVALADRIPSVGGSVQLPVANVAYVEEARSTLRLLNTLAYVLPWLAALCFLGAVLLAANRRRAIVTTGLLVAGAALLVGLAVAIGRGLYLDSITSEAVSQETAAVVFDTVVRFLRNGIRVIFFFGLLLAFGAAVSGPTAWATKTREVTGSLFTQGGAKTGWDTGAFGSFVAAHRKGLQLGAAGLAGALVFVVDRPTPGTLVWLLIGLLILLAAVQFLAATAPREAAPSPESAESPESQLTAS